MKTKCIHKSYEGISQELFPSGYLSERIRNFDFHLDVGGCYVVYGITLRDSLFWYYIFDKTSVYYPIWKPSILFEVTDPRLSRYWIYTFNKLRDYPSAHPIISFPEWANNHPDFYDKLSDGSEKEVKIFQAYKNQMDLEFPDDSIKEVAQIGDENWLLCPICNNAWEHTEAINGMVNCSECRSVLHNPRYKKITSNDQGGAI